MSGPDGWAASPTIARAIELRDGVIQNPKILSFQARAADYPHALLGIPFKGGTRVIHYDSTLFQQWGVDPLNEHPTLQEIHDKAIAMTFRRGRQGSGKRSTPRL